MLRTRVITAVCLLLVVLPAMFLDPAWIWSLLTLGFVVVGGWEWRRLLVDCRNQANPGRARNFALILLVLGLFWFGFDAWQPAWSDHLSVALMSASAIFWILRSGFNLRSKNLGGAWLAGLLVFACWLSLIELRLLGPVALVAALALVWTADVGAYFVGRGFGRRKLAPTISPGKSWEGAIGGAFLVVVIGLSVAASPALRSSLPAVLVASIGPIFAAMVLFGLSALSVVGDLYESALKREAGVKDSARTLPGHGGVLDRIDALIPVMPCIALAHRFLQ